MTQASKWRIELARKITPIYADNPKVKAVIVGGSVSYGVADRYSDVEIGVFWSEPPSEDERKAAANLIGVYRVIKPFSENAEDPDAGANEDIYIAGNRETGFQVDIKHRLADAIEKNLNNPESDAGHVIQNAIPLYGHALIKQWKAGIVPYPKELKKKEIENRFEKLGPWWLWEKLVQEDERVLICLKFNGILEDITVTLRWLNNAHDINYIKWPERAIQEFQIVPRDYWARYQLICRESPKIGIQQLRLLVEETLDLVETHLPEIEVASIREKTFNQRPKWVIRSAVKKSELSLWQHDLLNTLTRTYTSIHKVKAILLSGAVSQKTEEDIEITIFWSESPSDEDRKIASGGRLQNLHPYDAGKQMREDKYRFKGVNILIRHYTLESVQNILISVIDQYDPAHFKQTVIATLQHGIPLYGDAIIKKWQNKARAYPRELAQNRVRLILSEISWQWCNRIEIYAHRQALPFFFYLLYYHAIHMLRILMTLNRIYIPGGLNRMNPFIEKFQIAPSDFSARLKSMFFSEPITGVKQLNGLIEHLFTCIESYMPEVDTTEARNGYKKERRKAWDHPPEGVL